MRGPTLLLFSLIIGAVILSFTADRLDHLMGGKQPVPETVNKDSFYERSRKQLARVWQQVQDHMNRIGSDDNDHDNDYQTLWTWQDDDGTHHFSDTRPDDQHRASKLRIAPMKTAEETATPSPSTPYPSTPETSASEKDPAPLLDDGEFLQGLRDFRRYQQSRENPDEAQ